MKRRLGFTLIELLVVVAIIAILAAILFPIYASARTAAHRSACMSNMKQWNSAINLYRSDYGGFLPQANNIWFIQYTKPASTFQYHYFEELRPYLKSTEVAKCPAQAITAIRESLGGLWYDANGQPTRWYGAVYTMSMWPYPQGANGGKMLAHMVWSKGSSLVNPDTVNYYKVYNCAPSQAIMLFCMSGSWTITWNDDTIRRKFPDGIAHGPHGDGTPALFADGHVLFVHYSKVGNL